MTNYKMQYWLYAILNKKFGREVKFTRSSLHARYHTNRHEFDVTSHNVRTTDIARELAAVLLSGGYEVEQSCGEYVHYLKVIYLKGEVERRFVRVVQNISRFDNHKSLSVSGSIYRSKT